MKTALGLSMGIFSLSVLEVVPSAWLVVLDHGMIGILHSGYLSVTGAYWILLWALCSWTMLLLPGIVGGQVYARQTNLRRAHDDRKSFLQLLSPSPWWMRFMATCIMLVGGIVVNVLLMPLSQLMRRQLRPSKSEPMLILTHNASTAQDRSSPRSPNTMDGLSSKSYLIGASAGILTTLAILRTLGNLVISQPDEKYNMLSTLVSWLCAIGLILSSILNGFGSVSLPHSCLAGFYLDPIQPAVMAQAEMELLSATKSLEVTAAELSDGAPATSTQRRKQASRSRSSFADYGNNEEMALRKQSLQQDVDFLDMLVVELQQDISEMKYAQHMAEQARTPMGRVKIYLGMVFSVVLLVRLYTSIMSFVQMDDTKSTSSTRDPITTALLWLTGHHYVNQEDYTTLSQGISLLLTIFLSFTQFQTFLRTVESVHRRVLLLYRKCHCTQKRDATHDADHTVAPTNNPVYMHVLAGLTGCYCLSCVVLTKMNVPLEYRAGFSAALGGMDFRIQSSVLNLVFSVSAAVSATVLGLLFGIQRQNTKRHASTHSETLSSLEMLDSC